MLTYSLGATLAESRAESSLAFRVSMLEVSDSCFGKRRFHFLGSEL